jgi:hypothetical protein
MPRLAVVAGLDLDVHLNVALFDVVSHLILIRNLDVNCHMRISIGLILDG